MAVGFTWAEIQTLALGSWGILPLLFLYSTTASSFVSEGKYMSGSA